MTIADQILYEDNHLLAINKLPGQITQGDKTGDPCLADLVKAYLKERDNNISVYGSRSLSDKDTVSVENTGINHAFSFYPEHKCNMIAEKLCRYWKIAFNVRNSKDWFAGSNTTYNRNINNFTSCHIKGIIYNFYGTWFCFVS